MERVDLLLLGARDRRRFLRDALAIAVSALGLTSVNDTLTEVGYVTGTRPFIPYTSDAFLRSRAAGAPINETRTTQMHTFMAGFPDQQSWKYPSLQGLGTNLWGTVYATGQATDPVWKLTGTVATKIGFLKTTGFHAPSWLGSLLTGTSDSPFVVIDRAGGFTVWGGKAVKGSGNTISVNGAGVMWHTSNGLDYRNSRSTDSRNMTSRGRISESLVIRRDMVDYAIANNTDLGYVLELFIAETDAGHCHPMVGDEGPRGGFGMEGERMVIRPDVDLSTRGMTPAGLAIARTLQNYGCYIGDNAGGMSTLKCEQERSGHPVWGGLLNARSLKGITWADFAMVQAGWQ